MSIPTLKILCFGDSLTAGYTNWGMEFTPYSEELDSLLEEHFGLTRNIKVLVDGVSGQKVTQGFKQRMLNRISNSQANHAPYDWVIFLGGTNDLGYREPVPDIWQEMQAITSIPLSSSSRVLMLTIPECKAVDARLDASRSALNSLILEDDRENVHKLDLRALIPYHSMPLAERALIWDDGLHFKPAGYARIGKLVAEALLKIIGPVSSAITGQALTSETTPPAE